jgi:hypothetical protein
MSTMTEQQYTMAESQLIARIQAMRETESGARIVLPKKTTSGGQNSCSMQTSRVKRRHTTESK